MPVGPAGSLTAGCRAITRRVRQRLVSVSTQAVYDVLGALSRAGLSRRIEPAGSTPCLDPGPAHGFQVDEAEVTFWGRCPACQARRAADD